MAKARTVFRCTACGGEAPRWAGRCAACAAWNTLTEELAPTAGRRPAAGPDPLRQHAVPVAALDVLGAAARPTGVAELDRVLGGGLVPGSVTVLGGEPGVGKSTLLTQVASRMAAQRLPVLYISAEESPTQVRRRAGRVGQLPADLWVAADTLLPNIVAHLDDVEPTLVVIDSIQTIEDPELPSAPGSVVQVRECAHRLVREARDRDIAIVLVGHVTKDGVLAGPRVLEHVVDTVLAFEGDRQHALRLLRAVKHRFGATNELGVFEMADDGLVDVPDASGLFLADRRAGVAGSMVVPTIEGSRPLLVELQALVASSSLALPRRSAQGVDAGRLALLLAVLERRVHLEGLAKADVFALAVGGVRVMEPGADLGLALAIASAVRDVALPENLVACGEVGLGGELRQVAQTSRRLAEAARLGFESVVLPLSAPEPPKGLDAWRFATLEQAVTAVVPTTIRRDGPSAQRRPA